MYTNGINNYNTVREDTSKSMTTNQNSDFDGEAFSDLMDKEQYTGGGLRESAKELAEDESILSTDEENRAMIKKQPASEEQTPKPHFAQEEDKARLLRLMDMSNKLNMSGINISRSKRELENAVGFVKDEPEEPEDISSVIAKMMADKKEQEENVNQDDIQSSINMDKPAEDFEENKGKNSQILHETEEELLEDMSILSTEEENLEMARRNSANKMLSDDDYKTTQDDMIFMSEIVALNNQANIGHNERIAQTQNVLAILKTQASKINKIDMRELNSSDVDFIIGVLRMGTSDASNYTNEDNDELDSLSRKFLAMLRDSIINKKVFRIDFDNKISVIIRIDIDGKLNAEFQAGDEATEIYLKNNLHVLREKFEEMNIEYGEVTYKNTNKE